MADPLHSLDLMLTRRQPSQVVSDRDTVDLGVNRRDLAVVEGRNNLAQALLNRLHTRKGELAALGHPEYGSRLYQLMGELNNTRTRTLADMYVRESLAQESRIAEVIHIQVAPPSRGDARTTLAMVITVKLVGDDTPLTLALSLNLGG